MTISKTDIIPAVTAIDCGNTSLDMAKVRGQDVFDFQKLLLKEIHLLPEVIEKLHASGESSKAVVACSVNDEVFPEAKKIIEKVTKHKIKVVGPDLPLPLPVRMSCNKHIGADRVCAAAAAYDRLGKPCVIADFGSAITIDCVGEGGIFLGGAIMPGLGMSAESLAEKTSRLPHIEPGEPEHKLSLETPEAIKNGLVNGARHVLKGFVETYATELARWPEVILTGRDAGIICPEGTDRGIVTAVVEDLTIRGIAMAYYNSLLDNK